MYTNGIVTVVVVCTFVAMVSAWPYDDQYWQLARRSFGYCEGSGGKCFSTGQCCKGFVCAAFDDVLEDEASKEEGENPEIPGFCVKEKDLQPCYRRSECSSGSNCVSLGRKGEKYCVRNPEDPQRQVMNKADTNMGRGYRKPTSGIGADCEDDSDCKAFTEGNEKKEICCQLHRRGRTSARQICNIVTPISQCINKRK